jgi:hypothetical protein
MLVILCVFGFSKFAAGQATAAADESPVRAPRPAPSETTDAPDNGEFLKELWSERGTYSAIAVDQSNIYAIDASPKCIVFDAAGKRLKQFYYSGESCSSLRIARSSKVNRPLLILVGARRSLRVIDGDGNPLWDEVEIGQIHDLHVADLDRDGSDEIIVGHSDRETGATLGVYDCEGVPIWTYTQSENPERHALQICAGNLRDDKSLEIVVAFSDGCIQMFDRDGKELETIAEPLRFASVGLSRLPGDEFELIHAGGDRQLVETFIKLDKFGQSVWSIEFPEKDGYSHLLSVCRSQPWMIVGTERKGDVQQPMRHPSGLIESVRILNCADGTEMITVETWGKRPQFDWMTAAGTKHLKLIVATGIRIEVFAVKPWNARRKGQNADDANAQRNEN